MRQVWKPLGVVLMLFFAGAGPAAPPRDVPLAGYDRLLREHVDADGFVDYAGIAADPSGLRAYVDALAEVKLEGLSLDDQLATLINAYNAFTLELIIEHFDDGKLRSITELDDGKTWDAVRWDLAGQRCSLNQIEHELIRKRFDEPRIHWAVVCAAYSCPPLRPEVYSGDRIGEQLAEQEAYVLNFEHQRFVRRMEGSVGITKILEWYGSDFGDWRAYVRDRLTIDAETPITFLEYDWRINDISNRD